MYLRPAEESHETFDVMVICYTERQAPVERTVVKLLLLL